MALLCRVLSADRRTAIFPNRGEALGLVVAATIAAIGFAAHARAGELSALVVSLGVAVVAANAGAIPERARPGLAYAARHLLRLGIVLLGTQLSLRSVVELGGRSLLVVLVVVAGTFFGTQWLGRRLGVSNGLSLLTATGFSICGASAVAAMAPVADADEEDVTYAIALVTLCGSLAVVALPLLNRLWLGLDSATFGAWVGASVHDVAQTVAAASADSEVARESAVVVKLTRVVLLAPLVAGVSVARRRSGRATAGVERRPAIVPLFVVGFLIAVGVRSTGALSDDLVSGARRVEQVALAMALVGLGAGVRWSKLRRAGGRPLLLAVASWCFIASASWAGVIVVH